MAIREIKFQDFEDVINSPGLVLIDFWAPWCAPCRRFGPTFEKVSNDNPDAIFAKVNTEEEQDLAGALRIQSIPTLMVFRDAIPIFRQAGALPEAALVDLISQVRNLDMEVVKRQYEEAKKAAAAES